MGLHWLPGYIAFISTVSLARLPKLPKCDQGSVKRGVTKLTAVWVNTNYYHYVCVCFFYRVYVAIPHSFKNLFYSWKHQWDQFWNRRLCVCATHLFKCKKSAFVGTNSHKNLFFLKCYGHLMMNFSLYVDLDLVTVVIKFCTSISSQWLCD
jgi:hypothetical protein